MTEEQEKEIFEVKLKDILLEVNNQKGWEECVKANSTDGYSKCALDYTRDWGRLMQYEISQGKELKDIWKETSHQLKWYGITGFMYGWAVSALAEFWVHGEELRKLHNKSYGVDEDTEGTVNPAVLTISSKE